MPDDQKMLSGEAERFERRLTEEISGLRAEMYRGLGSLSRSATARRDPAVGIGSTEVTHSALRPRLDHVSELIAHEYRDDRRRRFVGAKAMLVT